MWRRHTACEGKTDINSAADVAEALKPIAGKFALLSSVSGLSAQDCCPPRVWPVPLPTHLQSVVPAGWDDGSSLTFMQELVRYWQYEFDWRAQEQRLNRLPHFIGEIDGFKIHYIHVSGRGPSPIPLVMTHGWPGSFLEMERVIPLLTDPGAFGGDPEDAFDLVVPSLPGYTFSSSPATAGIGPFEIAGLWQKLMTGLGYEKFGAQGGDIGAAVSSWLGFRFPENVLGLHLNYIPGSYSPPTGEGLPPITEEEEAFKKIAAEWASEEGAYAHMQGADRQTRAGGNLTSGAQQNEAGRWNA